MLFYEHYLARYWWTELGFEARILTSPEPTLPLHYLDLGGSCELSLHPYFDSLGKVCAVLVRLGGGSVLVAVG